MGVASEAAFCTRGHFIRHTPTNAHVRDPLKTASFLPHSPLALPPGVRDAHTLTPYLAGAQLEYTGPRLLLWSPLLLLLTEQHGTDSGGLSSILNTFHKVMVSWLISLPFLVEQVGVFSKYIRSLTLNLILAIGPDQELKPPGPASNPESSTPNQKKPSRFQV